MKIRLPFHPLIDPAYIYLSGFFLVVGLLVILGNHFLAGDSSSSSSSSSSYHRTFPSESEVKGIVRMGQTEDDVVAELGTPFSQGPLEDGVTVLNYVMPMSKEPPNDPSVYSGFSVYIKGGKVMDINIIRGSDLRNKDEHP